MELKLSGQVFKWPFLQAEVQMAILGVDFLRAYKLSVANWSRMVHPSSHQLFLVLLARQPLHPLFLVLLARQPHHHQCFLLLAIRQSLLSS
jgi:hypothetical protein